MRTRIKPTKKGIALIAVAAAIAIVAPIIFDFTYSTNVDYHQAAIDRDSMRAEYLARSVMNVAQIAIKLQHDVLDRNRRLLSSLGMPDLQVGDFASMLETPICGHKDEITGFAQTLGNVDTNGIKGLGIDFGECRIEKFETDDNKINANCANGSANTANALGAELLALVSNPIFDKMFEEKDGDGQFTDRQTFVSAILDYVDRDEAKFGTSGQAEDYGYQSMKDPYLAKNNYIDSIDELRLARGMDDRKWAVFGNEFTVYGGCKVNVSAVTDPLMIMGLLAQAAKDPNDPVLVNPLKLWQLATRISQARSLGLPFEDLNSFVSFVKDPDSALGLGSSDQSGSGGQSQNAQQAQALAAAFPPVDGMELDPTKLNLVAKAGARRTYRIVASARVGKAEKKIIGVWDTEHVNQNMRDPAYARGAWVYWRIE
jgi:general secretion pathway protein K